MRRPGSRGTVEADADRGLTFADVFDASVDEVYRFVHRRCRDHTMAEDITQEAFMAAIRTFDQPGDVTTGWLMTVARNRLFDMLRRQTRYAEKLRLVGAAGDGSADSELAERLRVEAALNELSVDHRLVLTLHYIDGYTVPALAQHLDRSVKSIEGLVTRARRELRARLEETEETAGMGEGHA